MPINTAKMSFVTTDALFPTKLNKYLKICKKYKKHPVIELKDKRIDLNYLKILHGTISKYINRNKVYIASFNFKALKLVDDFFADYKTIYLVEKRNSEKSKTAKNALLRKIRKLIKEQKNVGIQPHMVSEELVELAHEYEVKVYV
jgi:glycerophosphoryl diester phosphodiesterase